MTDIKEIIDRKPGQTLAFLFSHCLWLYLGAAILLFFLLDSSTARLNRLNALKQIESDVKEFEEGKREFDSNEFLWAVRYYQELLKSFPKSAPLYGNLGFCYHYLKNDEKAVEFFRKAITLEPKLSTPYWDMGMILFQVGNFQKSIFFLNKFLDLLPMTRKYYMESGENLRAQGKKDMIYWVMLLAHRAREDELEAYLKLATSYFVLKDFRNMRDIALRGLNIYPRNQGLHYNAGLAHFLLANYPESINYLNIAIKLDPKDINAYYYRGLCLKKLGQLSPYEQNLQSLADLKDKGIKPKEIVGDDFKLHLNTELMVLRHQM